MSRQTVRRGIAVYLGGTYDTTRRVCTGNTTFGVTLVRPGFPKRVPNDDFGLGDGVLSGSYVNVHIREQREKRIADGGAHNGLKQVRYDVVLHVFHRSVEPHGEDAEDHLEQVTDGLLQRIRADRTLGGAVFQGGEGVSSASSSIDDLIIGYGEPEDRGDIRDTYAGIAMSCTEYLQT